jgi:hypothetical protein
MKFKTLLIIITGITIQLSLITGNAVAQKIADTLSTLNSTLSEKVSGIEERLTIAEGDLAKLTKIKLSGYIQAQWQRFENPSIFPGNYFSVRRARVKVIYEPLSGVTFVLQPDFSPGAIALKDAYVQVNDPWLKTFSLWAGQFNRPNYEVEYSSTNREVAERSLVIRTLYPGERAIGAKLEIVPPAFPLKVQLALFNGNDGLTINDATGSNVNPTNKDYDNGKDFMGRAAYAFKLGNLGGLTIGANGYYGTMKASSNVTLASDYKIKEGSVTIGSNLNRSWLGAELQLYLDFLGGMSIKGEYLTGTNSYPGFYGKSTAINTSGYSLQNDTLTVSTITTTTITKRPDIIKNFRGYYIYLVKNIGKRHQIALRYDYYDPNTKLTGSDIGSLDNNGQAIYGYDGKISPSGPKTTISKPIGSNPVVITKDVATTFTVSKLSSDVTDIATHTLSIAYSYFFSDNIKFMIDYDIVMNEKVSVDPGTNSGNITNKLTVNNVNGYLDYSKVIPQNILTLRLQVKF